MRILVIGLGDLGSRILSTLAVEPGVTHLIGAARNREHGEQQVGQAALLTALLQGPRHVNFVQIDLDDPEGMVAALRRIQPDITVFAASRYTWWRSPAADPERRQEVAALPYGAWLPVQAAFVRRFMRAYFDAGHPGRVLSLPYPDGVGPVLSPAGLAPHLGAGNVTEDAAKVAVVAARILHLPAAEVDVRLVMHHAAERLANPAFAGLAGEGLPEGEPPWRVEVRAWGAPIPEAEAAAMFRAAYARPAGIASHDVTAAAAVNLVRAMCSEQPVPTHAPAPSGLPGGYPVWLSRSGWDFRLPSGLDIMQARELNEAAARWDGIARIAEDGTIVYLPAVTAVIERVLGIRVASVSPRDLDAVADEMLVSAARAAPMTSPSHFPPESPFG